MILYHGSNIDIDTPDLSKCRPYKDFGQGFYLTDIKEQAQRIAAKTVKLYGGTSCLNKFSFDLDKAIEAGLKIKTFDNPCEEWAQFVVMNRDIYTPQPSHDYDIVIGPVADDNIAMLLRRFTKHYIDKEELLKGLTFSEVTSQYFFHTEAALKMLKKL